MFLWFSILTAPTIMKSITELFFSLLEIYTSTTPLYLAQLVCLKIKKITTFHHLHHEIFLNICHTATVALLRTFILLQQVIALPAAEKFSPSNTSVFRLNAGNLTTSSYVTRSSWSKTALCLAKYLSFFFRANHEQFTARKQQQTKMVSVSVQWSYIIKKLRRKKKKKEAF